MNFGDSIKREIFSKIPKEKHCKKAFLAGLIRGSGVLYEDDGVLGFQFKLQSDENVMVVSSMFRQLFGCEIREVSVVEDRLNKRDNFIVSVSGEQAENILKELEILIEVDKEYAVNLKVHGELTKNECCLHAFIKGLFVATGRCTLPKTGSAGYYLEMSFSHYAPAEELSEILRKSHIETRALRRKENFVLYIKSVEGIKDFVAFLPAPISALKLADFIINRDLSNNSNRAKNCDLGNVNKQVEASGKQLEAIEKIEKNIGLNSLKPDLKLTAITRMENPEDTLSELAERLSISKSCLNHRLRNIIAKAKEI